MNIKDERITLDLRSDPVIVKVLYTITFVDTEDKHTGGVGTETVWLIKNPHFNSDYDARESIVKASMGVRVSPTDTWREVRREHVFTLPRYPFGPFNTVSLSAHVSLRPAMRVLWDEKTFGWGVLAPKYSISSTFQRVAEAIRKVFRR